MSSYDEIFGLNKKTGGGRVGGGGGGGGAVGQARWREAANDRQAEEEHKAHERELAKGFHFQLGKNTYGG